MSESEGRAGRLIRQGILVVILVLVGCILIYDQFVASPNYSSAVSRLEAELEESGTNENLSGTDISEILGREPVLKTDYADNRAFVERYEWSRGFPGLSYKLNVVYSKPLGSDRYFLAKFVQGKLKEEHLPKKGSGIDIVFNPPPVQTAVAGGGGGQPGSGQSGADQGDSGGENQDGKDQKN